MDNSKFILSFVGAALLLSACSKESGSEVPEVPGNNTPTPAEKLEIRISPTLSATKATDYGFETNDRIGLYVVNFKDGKPGTLLSKGNHVDNMRFTYNGTWEPDSKIYWLDNETHADIYLYYPYAASVSSVEAMPFAVKGDQSGEANYKGSDMLVGKTGDVAPSTSAISILANHVMSRMSITLAAGNGFTTESLAAADVAVKVNNLKTNATVNLSTSAVTATGDASVMTPFLQNDTYRMVVVPQKVAESDLVTVTVDGREYNFKKEMTFESGKNYNFTLTLSKTSAGINVSIGSWDNDGEDYGGTAE
jgi:hypothetical protein